MIEDELDEGECSRAYFTVAGRILLGEAARAGIEVVQDVVLVSGIEREKKQNAETSISPRRVPVLKGCV